MTALLWAGAAGTAIFVLTFTIDGATRSGYHPARHPVSALALGRRGWVQTTNFILCGSLVTLAAVAVPPTADSILLALLIGGFGLALIASGVFPMDPMRGYPPGTPDKTPTSFSRRHQLHDGAGAAVFGAMPLLAFVGAWALDGVLRWLSLVVGIALVGLVVGFGSAWEKDSPRAGLVQRGAIVLGWAWLTLLFGSLASG